MSFSERKSSSFKECSNDTCSSISTFVIKIYNLLNVRPPYNSGAAKRIGNLLAPRRSELPYQGHCFAHNARAAPLLPP